MDRKESVTSILRDETGLTPPEPVRSHVRKIDHRCGAISSEGYSPSERPQYLLGLITFYMTGYFNQVNHIRLLAILRNNGISLPMYNRVQSSVNRRETRRKVDGFTCRVRAVRTGCPQGSPVSRVLAIYYSPPLLEVFA